MDGLKTALLGSAEVLASVCVGVLVASPIPPLAIAIIPACAVSSAISVIATPILAKILDLDTTEAATRFSLKSVTLFVGVVISSIVAGIILLPMSLEIALIAASIIALASVIGAVAIVVLEEAPDIYHSGSNSYYLNIRTGGSYRPYYTRPSYRPNAWRAPAFNFSRERAGRRVR